MSTQGEPIEAADILKMLPHRYPFLLVDRVLAFDPGKQLTAIKNVSLNEPFFQGHFPGYPVMPGVLIIEALAQAGGILVMKSADNLPENRIFLFSGIEKARFRKPVFPGDQLHLQVTFLRQRMSLWKMEAEARVSDQLAAQAVLTAALVQRGSEGP
jgi:3-hydroxyacyl-[acyl-carrier-protein] dehydratase